jgi:hypothetical protein
MGVVTRAGPLPAAVSPGGRDAATTNEENAMRKLSYVSRLCRIAGPLVLAPWLVLGSPAPGAAQPSIDFSQGSGPLFGFTVKPPQQVLGLGATWSPPALRGWGVLADVRFATDRPDSNEIRRDWTRSDALGAGHEFVRSQISWNSSSVALVRGITREMAVFAGAGLSRSSAYSQFLFDTEEGEVLEIEIYFIEEPERAEDRVNWVGGALYRMGSRLAVQVGIQSEPFGFVVGGYFLPF